MLPFLLKIEDYNAEIIDLKKNGKIYSAKKLGIQDYSNFKSGDLSKFKFIQAKVKMIQNRQRDSNTPLLCGIHRLKSYQNDKEIFVLQGGIYFFHFSDSHIYGSGNYGLKTDLKFDSNGECLTIQVDRTNDLLSFVDDHNKRWSIQLSKVVGEDLFAFSFKMYEPKVEIQFQFFINTPKEFPDTERCFLF